MTPRATSSGPGTSGPPPADARPADTDPLLPLLRLTLAELRQIRRLLDTCRTAINGETPPNRRHTP